VEGIVTHEATAWMRAADIAGVELPESITEARANLAKVEEQFTAMPLPDKVPDASELVARGASLEEAAEEIKKLSDAAAQAAENRGVVSSARTLARGRLSRLVAEERDSCIINARPVVDALIAAARPLTEELRTFAPMYDAGTIARRANPEQVEAWREAEELERKFGTIMAAWRTSFRNSNVQGGYKSPSKVPGFDIRWVDQVHRYFERPEYVSNPRLNGTYLGRSGYPVAIEPTVLAVACEPERAGFRVCTVRELKEAYDVARFAAIEEARQIGSQRRHGRGMAV
jgi:hypothetical protein